MKRWQKIAIIVVAMIIYCVLMSVRGSIHSSGLRTVAGVVAGLSIGIALIVSLRMNRPAGGRPRRRR